MSWYSFRPYVPVAERRLQAAKAAQKMSKGGRTLAPIQIAGRAIATTFWGKAWCDNLEAYSDFANRLPRGRTYVRSGSVIDLQINAGKVTALVQGSDLYKISISIRRLVPSRWTQFKTAAAGKITNLLDLVQGRLGKELLAGITARDAGLFPAPKEIELDCSCPDWADMCKHVAAVLYGVGARLDSKPELFFTLRGLDLQELLTAASDGATSAAIDAKAAESALTGADLNEIFGVDIESDTPAPAPANAPGARVDESRTTSQPKNPRAQTVARRSKPSVRKRQDSRTKLNTADRAPARARPAVTRGKASK